MSVAEQEDDSVSSVSDVFISLVIAASNDSNDNNDDDNNDNDLPPVPTLAPVLSTTSWIPRYKKITLKDLFVYPSTNTSNTHQAFHFYQAHGCAALDAEEEEVAQMFTSNT